MPTIIQNAAGEKIGYGKNLQAVLARARHHTVDEVYCFRVTPFDPAVLPYYDVQFVYSDGSVAFTDWADWRVLTQWIKARRSWRINRIAGDSEWMASLAEFLANQKQ